MKYVTCAICDNDLPVQTASDEDAIIDFIAALLAGDVATARILTSRAFGDLIDTGRIDKLFADRGRTFHLTSEASS